MTGTGRAAMFADLWRRTWHERRTIHGASRPDPPSPLGRGRITLLLALALTLVPGAFTPAAVVMQRGFASPEEAVAALVDAVKTDNKKALVDILGPDGRSLVDSGDAVADRNARQRFVAAYESAHHLAGGGGKVVLYVGRDDFPLAIPLVPDGIIWRFDTAAGKEEILNRRIGRDELNTIQTCLAYVDAQKEYYSEDRNADGIHEYATRFANSPNKHDDLF